MDKLFLSGNNTKAGIPELSRERIDSIILEASKGSKFYQHQQRRLQLVAEKTRRLRQAACAFTASELSHASVQVDDYVASLRASLPQSRVFVHVDMDAFFAAVEEQFDPALASLPMAVGGDAMLCTANYNARRFGVSAAMPGFIARKLCPDLVIVPLHYGRYVATSEKVHAVFREYDPNFQSFSLDEASLDLTGCRQEGRSVEELVEELRAQVKQRCRLTCSAGIGPTRQLAKMASNVNKPDGQCSLVHFSDADLLDWLHPLPVKRICGVGKVTAAILDQAFDVKTVGDLHAKRPHVWLGMTEKQAQFLVAAAHGLAPSVYDTASADEGAEDDDEGASSRKSISVERTYFPPLTETVDMESKLYGLSEALLADLKHRQLGCGCVSIKVKLADFRVFSRSVSVKHRVETVEEVFALSCQLLHKLAPVDARLLGVRASALESTKPTFLDRFLAADQDAGSNSRVSCPVCSLMVAEHAINGHLDQCLRVEEKDSRPQQQQPKKPKPGPMDAFLCK